MSNSRLAAIGYVFGFFIAAGGNLADPGGLLIDCVRLFVSGVLIAAVAVALFGDRKCS